MNTGEGHVRKRRTDEAIAQELTELRDILEEVEDLLVTIVVELMDHK